MPNLDSKMERSISKTSFHSEQKIKSASNWFFWICGLSILNSLIIVFGGQWSFIVGLGITQIVDGIMLTASQQTGHSLGIIAVIINILISSIFIVFGVFARKKQKWAFIAGMIIYAIDGLLFLLVIDILSIGFHIFALFQIFTGLKALNESERLPLEDLDEEIVLDENNITP